MDKEEENEYDAGRNTQNTHTLTLDEGDNGVGRDVELAVGAHCDGRGEADLLHTEKT